MKKDIKFKRISVTFLVFVVLLFVAGCGAKSGYKDGSYEGTSTAGIDGEVKVEVNVASGKIAEVVVTSQNETEGIGTMAVEQLPAKIVEAQSTEVDNVSGATVSSTAIKEAVNNALEKAK